MKELKDKTISVEKTIATAFKLANYCTVEMERVDEKEVNYKY
jgi:hypothetical protein